MLQLEVSISHMSRMCYTTNAPLTQKFTSIVVVVQLESVVMDKYSPFYPQMMRNLSEVLEE